MPSENQILTLKLNSENKLIQAQPEKHCFLDKNESLELCNQELHQAIKSELYEYYLKQSYRVQSSKQFGSYPAEIMFIDEIKYLVQLHYENKVINHESLQTILYFNFINIDSYSKGRNLAGSYLEDKAIEMQLTAASEQVNLLTKEDDNWITEDSHLFNKLEQNSK